MLSIIKQWWCYVLVRNTLLWHSVLEIFWHTIEKKRIPKDLRWKYHWLRWRCDIINIATMTFWFSSFREYQFVCRQEKWALRDSVILEMTKFTRDSISLSFLEKKFSAWRTFLLSRLMRYKHVIYCWFSTIFIVASLNGEFLFWRNNPDCDMFRRAGYEIASNAIHSCRIYASLFFLVHFYVSIYRSRQIAELCNAIIFFFLSASMATAIAYLWNNKSHSQLSQFIYL